MQRADEDALTKAIIALASEYGRYGLGRIMVELHKAGGQGSCLAHLAAGGAETTGILANTETLTLDLAARANSCEAATVTVHLKQ